MTKLHNNMCSCRYGGGPIFLKEMLSNADDAGATSFHVLLDKTEYTKENLLDKSMQDMQQASLLVANDSVFSDSNLHEYNDAGASGKANDSSTCGRFGKGKLTAYIITDTIQLLTGSNLLFIDPHETRLPNRPQQMRTNIVSNEGFHPNDKVLSHLEPFRKATASWPAVKPWTPGEHCPGTMFSLALRTPEAAAVSQISQKVTTADELQADTLTKFCCVAPDLLRFTNSVSTISVYVKESADSEAELLHTCTVDRQSLGPSSGPVELKQLTVTAKTAQQGNESACKIWIVATKGTPGLGPDQEPLLYASVAALLHEGPAGSEAAKLEIPHVQGRLHSKMPLPFESPGLPVHIDSYFEVHADRRKLCSGVDDWGKVSTILLDKCSRLHLLVCAVPYTVSMLALTVSTYPPKASARAMARLVTSA